MEQIFIMMVFILMGFFICGIPLICICCCRNENPSVILDKYNIMRDND